MAQMTEVNQMFVGRDTPEMRRLTWLKADGTRAGGLLYLPPKRVRPSDPTRVPVVLDIYPGSGYELNSIRDQSYVGEMYFGDERNEGLHQAMWNAGYAILLPDVVFKGDGHACEEITAGTVAALDAAKKSGLVNADRAGVTGESFGGYSVNCVVTHTTRFRAAVEECGMSNLVDFDLFKEGGTGGGQAKLGGSFPDVLERYIADSPVFHTAGVTTPLLLMHGKVDGNVPFPEAVSMFRALERQGKVAKLIGYDGVGHGMENPDANRQAIAWFDRFLKSEDGDGKVAGRAE
jgi:dipeptidyl aminopeptidase/acylaminoacyl peptidase